MQTFIEDIVLDVIGYIVAFVLGFGFGYFVHQTGWTFIFGMITGASVTAFLIGFLVDVYKKNRPAT